MTSQLSFSAALRNVIRYAMAIALVIAMCGAAYVVFEVTIAQTRFYKDAKESAYDWWMEHVHGEDANARLARKLREIRER